MPKPAQINKPKSKGAKPAGPKNKAAKEKAPKTGGAGKVKSANDQKAGDKKTPKSPTPNPGKKVAKPAYMQTKMAVSTPGDKHEKEADGAAEEISRMPRDTKKPGKKESVAPENTADQPQSLQTKISRLPQNEAQKPAHAAREMATGNSELASRESAGNHNGQGDTPQLSEEAEHRIDALRGQGAALPEDVRHDMESKFAANFSRVTIHTDSEADQLCKQINARAFTVGNDIFFASGEYAPGTESGRKLLAHELTHVVQQSGGINRMVMRDDNGTGTGAGGGGTSGGDDQTPEDNGRVYISQNYKYISKLGGDANKEVHIPTIKVPNFKRRNDEKFSEYDLRRLPGARNTQQPTKWRQNFESDKVDLVSDNLDSSLAGSSDGEVHYYQAKHNDAFKLIGNRQQIYEAAVWPFWDRHGHARRFQVDHIVEDQLGGKDEIGNYELLDASANGSAGPTLAAEINREISHAIDAITGSPAYHARFDGHENSPYRMSRNVKTIKDNYIRQFDHVTFNLGRINNANHYWSKKNIEDGDHLKKLRKMSAREITRLTNGSGVTLFLSASGGRGIHAPTGDQQGVEIWPRVFTKGPFQGAVADNNGGGAEASTNTESAQGGGGFGTLSVDAYKAGQGDPNGVNAAYPDLVLYFRSMGGESVWALDKDETLRHARESSGGVFQSLRIPGMSPIQIDNLDLDPQMGFVGRGKLLPTVSLFRQADIDVLVEGSSVRIQKEFDLGEFDIPSPFHVDYSSILVFAGTEGLGAQGKLGFSIDKVGSGDLSAEISSGHGFKLDGQFQFDENLFGEGTSAEVHASYEKASSGDYEWSMGGSISIPEGKVPGISSATINVDYSKNNGFHASGDAELDIPGVESGHLEISQTPEEGFSIGGDFQLSAETPGIRGGSISARLTEKPDGSGYALSASGEAQPDIPGIDSNLSVTYDDGAITAEAHAEYARGMLSGTLDVGVTNRNVNEDGTLGDGVNTSGDLAVYGGGSLTLQLAPWLQGTAGVKFSPNGEMTVIGEVAVPDDLEIFPRQEINKSIFNIAVQAPIFPGIVAEVGGGLSATAGIGPGVFDELSLHVEYNPDHEEDTHVHGRAHLNIPADAGLRLSVRAGIGLGITGASATGGLEVGGTLGIEGAAEAGVDVDWTPSQGLDVSANLAVHAQPSFTFDISGYVAVTALGFSVYDHRWELASFSFGSDYQFGISLPIHYHEGEPFNISLSDVEFQVPDINTDRLLKGLIARIA